MGRGAPRGEAGRGTVGGDLTALRYAPGQGPNVKRPVHLHDAERSGLLTVGICGYTGQTSPKAARVTCKPCLRALAAVTARLAKAADDARRNVPPAVLSGRGQTDVGDVGERAIASSIAGEHVASRPRWGSVASALAAWAMTRDAARSVASSSAPSRFGHKAQDGGEVPTTPRGTQHDLLDVEAAVERGCQAVEVGGHYLTRAHVRAIVEARICGRPVDRAVGPRVQPPTLDKEAKRQALKRGTVRERVEASADDVAERCGLTRHQVGIVVRGARRAIAAELARKGLIPERCARDESTRHGTEERMAAEWDLEGWKSIAPLVRRSVEVCQRLARREADPLPVRRYLGSVVAKTADVEAWVSRQVAE